MWKQLHPLRVANSIYEFLVEVAIREAIDQLCRFVQNAW